MTNFELQEKHLAEIQETWERELLDGGAEDFADYRHRCGVIRGLALARRENIDLANMKAKEEDEDG